MVAPKTEDQRKDVPNSPQAQPANTDPSPPRLPGRTETRFSRAVANQLHGEGAREGTAVAPERPIRVQEVSSWMQVPQILAELQKDGGRGIRLTFPIPTSETEGAAEVRNEQRAIRSFLQENHSKSLAELVDTLAEKISACALFKEYAQGKFKNVTAKSWLASLQIDSKSTANLAVADVVDAAGIRQETENSLKDLRDQVVNVISESASAKRLTIVTVPAGEQEALKATLSAWYAESGEPKVDISRVSVWLGVPADAVTFDPTLSKAKECRSVKSISLAELLGITPPEDKKDAETGNKPNSPTVADGEVLGPIDPIDLTASEGTPQSPAKPGRVKAALQTAAKTGRVVGRFLDLNPPEVDAKDSTSTGSQAPSADSEAAAVAPTQKPAGRKWPWSKKDPAADVGAIAIGGVAANTETDRADSGATAPQQKVAAPEASLQPESQTHRADSDVLSNETVGTGTERVSPVALSEGQPQNEAVVGNDAPPPVSSEKKIDESGSQPSAVAGGDVESAGSTDASSVTPIAGDTPDAKNEQVASSTESSEGKSGATAESNPDAVTADTQAAGDTTVQPAPRKGVFRSVWDSGKARVAKINLFSGKGASKATEAAAPASEQVLKGAPTDEVAKTSVVEQPGNLDQEYLFPPTDVSASLAVDPQAVSGVVDTGVAAESVTAKADESGSQPSAVAGGDVESAGSMDASSVTPIAGETPDAKNEQVASSTESSEGKPGATAESNPDAVTADTPAAGDTTVQPAPRKGVLRSVWDSGKARVAKINPFSSKGASKATEAAAPASEQVLKGAPTDEVAKTSVVEQPGNLDQEYLFPLTDVSASLVVDPQAVSGVVDTGVAAESVTAKADESASLTSAVVGGEVESAGSSDASNVASIVGDTPDAKNEQVASSTESSEGQLDATAESNPNIATADTLGTGDSIQVAPRRGVLGSLRDLGKATVARVNPFGGKSTSKAIEALTPASEPVAKVAPTPETTDTAPSAEEVNPGRSAVMEEPVKTAVQQGVGQGTPPANTGQQVEVALDETIPDLLIGGQKLG